MNTLYTLANGGFPLTLNDFRFESTAVREAFKALVSPLGIDTFANGFILSGCEITGTSPNFNCAAGYICLKGEVYTVDAHAVPVPSVGQTRLWSIVETNDTAGAKSFENGVTVQTYKVRKVVITASIAPLDYLPVTLPPNTPNYRFIDKINMLRKTTILQNENWHGVGDPGEPTFGGGWSNHPTAGMPLEFMRDEFGNVRIRGNVTSTNAFTGSNVLFTLPTGYRPPQAIHKAEWVLAYAASTTDIARIIIDSDGSFKVASTLDASSFTQYYLNFDLSFNTL